MHPDDRLASGQPATRPGSPAGFDRTGGVKWARTWLSIRVNLVEGHGEQSWPRPGRIFAAARSHTFKQLADAIDDAFARWDRSHLQEFTLADGRRSCDPDPDWEIEDEVTQDYRRVKLSRLHPGEQFAYVFDLGDDWAHLCTVGARRTIRPALCRSRRWPPGARNTGPWQRSPMARSIARAVRGASGVVTTLPPLRVITRVR